MPSRAEVRGTFETALRAVSLIVLVWMIWLSLDRGRPETRVTSGTTSLSASLRDWTQRGIAPNRIAVSLDSVPTKRQRDWLAALRSAGSNVSWSGKLPAVGIEVQPIAAPTGGYNVLVSVPNEASVVIRDEVGPIDTVKAKAGGARVSVPSGSGFVTATTGGTTARTTFPDTLQIGRVLVIGNADWESKFVIAALEEDGWKVDAQLHVSPGVSVTQGSIGSIDTARYAAVIALDAWAAAHGNEIVRYATSGGGVVIAGSAAGLESLAPLRAGAGGRIESVSTPPEPGAVTLQSLSFMPVTGMKGDAIGLDKRSGAIASAARRSNGGRVIQLGYLDTWRWRMSGGDNGVAQHRKWWTDAVAAVAYAPAVDNLAKPGSDNAPMAKLMESLGPPSSAPTTSLASTAGSISLWLLFAILSVSLLAEWVSRRTRGVR